MIPAQRVTRMCVIGVDQAGDSGVAGLDPNGKVIMLTTATTARHRLQAIRDMRDMAEAIGAPLVGVLEDHSKVTLRAKTRADGKAPKRNTATILGMGDARGRWREDFDLLGVRHTMVAPDAWRPAVLGIAGNTPNDVAKACAVEWASRMCDWPVTSDNEAEAIAIAWWGLHAFVTGQLAAMRPAKGLIE